MKCAYATIFVLLLTGLFAGCGGGDGPSTSELQASLLESLPAYYEVGVFKVKASQNMGSDVDPLFASRIIASAQPLVDLYKKIRKENDVVFVELTTPKGTKIELFGRIESKMYEGVWKHSVDLEGNPISYRNKPLDEFGSRTILVGSSEEQEYQKQQAQMREEAARLEQERAEAEARLDQERAEAEARRLEDLRIRLMSFEDFILGEWQVEVNYRIYRVTYRADGTGEDEFDTGSGLGLKHVKRQFKWNYEGGTFRERGYRYKITAMSDDSFTADFAGGVYTGARNKGDEWSATRVK